MNVKVMFFFYFAVHTKELTIDNFTFFKEPIGVGDPDKEIIRDAKRMRVCYFVSRSLDNLHYCFIKY